MSWCELCPRPCLLRRFNIIAPITHLTIAGVLVTCCYHLCGIFRPHQDVRCDSLFADIAPPPKSYPARYSVPPDSFRTRSIMRFDYYDKVKYPANYKVQGTSNSNSRHVDLQILNVCIFIGATNIAKVRLRFGMMLSSKGRRASY